MGGPTPIPILEEMLRQLAYWYPGQGDYLDNQRGLLRRHAAYAQFEDQLSGRPEALDYKGIFESAEVMNAVSVFNSGMKRCEKEIGKIILILDTFEEIQYRGVGVVNKILETLSYINDSIGGVFVVIFSRGGLHLSGWQIDADRQAPEYFRAKSVRDLSSQRGDRLILDLGTLPDHAALKYLQDSGLDPTTAKSIIERWGKHTLTLLLMSQFFQKDSVQAHRWLSLDRSSVTDDRSDSFQEENKHVVLFSRIVSYIHDHQVKSIIIPSFIPRFISEDCIKEVLSHFAARGNGEDLSLSDADADTDAAAQEEPRGLCKRIQDEPERVFLEMKREISVAEIDGERLYFRPDLRTMMLRILQESEKNFVNDVHRRMVEYYDNKIKNWPSGAADSLVDIDLLRAELIYHRICLGEPYHTIKPKRRRAVAQYLDTAQGDGGIGPGEPRLTLVLLLNEEVTETDLEAASPETRRTALVRLSTKRPPPDFIDLVRKYDPDLQAPAVAVAVAKAFEQMAFWGDGAVALKQAAAEIRRGTPAGGVSLDDVLLQLSEALFNDGDLEAAHQVIAELVPGLTTGQADMSAVLAAQVMALVVDRVRGGATSDHATEVVFGLRRLVGGQTKGAQGSRRRHTGGVSLMRRIALLVGRTDVTCAQIIVEAFPWGDWRLVHAERVLIRDALKSWPAATDPRHAAERDRIIERLLGDTSGRTPRKRAMIWTAQAKNLFLSIANLNAVSPLAADSAARLMEIFSVRGHEWKSIVMNAFDHDDASRSLLKETPRPILQEFGVSADEFLDNKHRANKVTQIDESGRLYDFVTRVVGVAPSGEPSALVRMERAMQRWRRAFDAPVTTRPG